VDPKKKRRIIDKPHKKGTFRTDLKGKENKKKTKKKKQQKNWGTKARSKKFRRPGQTVGKRGESYSEKDNSYIVGLGQCGNVTHEGKTKNEGHRRQEEERGIRTHLG